MMFSYPVFKKLYVGSKGDVASFSFNTLQNLIGEIFYYSRIGSKYIKWKEVAKFSKHFKTNIGTTSNKIIWTYDSVLTEKNNIVSSLIKNWFPIRQLCHIEYAHLIVI